MCQFYFYKCSLAYKKTCTSTRKASSLALLLPCKARDKGKISLEKLSLN